MRERQTSEYLNDDNADGNANQYSNVIIEPRLKGSLTSLHSQYTVYNNYTIIIIIIIIIIITDLYSAFRSEDTEALKDTEALH